MLFNIKIHGAIYSYGNSIQFNFNDVVFLDF